MFAEWVTTYLEQSGCTWQYVSDVRNSFPIGRCLSHTRIVQIALVSIRWTLFVSPGFNERSPMSHDKKHTACNINISIKRGMSSTEWNIL